MEYYMAKQRAPQRMAEIIADIKRQPPERQLTQGRINTKDRNLGSSR